MEKLIKENIIYIILVVAVIAGGVYGIVHFASMVVESHGEVVAKKAELTTKEEELSQIKRRKADAQREQKKSSQSGKVIYEVLGAQFSPEASFGVMFESIISHINSSGLRIRSIDYNYKPTDDKILMANVPGYNVCELGFVAVGNYTQLQNFFKNTAKEKFLTNINEIYIEPYDKDKTILIARFKIRLYTKTI